MMHLREVKKQFATPCEWHGFTMVDMMVALAIIGILAALAYPSLQDAVRKGKRTEARAALMQLMQQQERFYSQHNTYIKFSSSSSDDDGKKFKWFSGNSATSSAYEIKAEACRNDVIQNCVLMTAMPGTGSVDSKYKDPVCGDLKLTSTGLKEADSPDCWK